MSSLVLPVYFYAFTVLAMGTRCLVYKLLGKSLHDSNKRTVPQAIVPSWMLRRCGQKSTFLVILPAMLVCFAFAAFNPDSTVARLAAAVSHILFSMGCAYALEWGHGQYPVLYTSIGLVFDGLTGDQYSIGVAVARTTAIYLYVCAGLTKIYVPESLNDYFFPQTMRTLLMKTPERTRFNPLFPKLTCWLAQSDAAMLFIVWATMILELIAVPAVLFVDDLTFRTTVVFVCVLFHLGIWFVFTSTAGTMFFQLSGVYVLGFCGDIVCPFPLWALSASMALSPFAKCLWDGNPFVASERWPLTNCALFPWSSKQINFIQDNFVDGQLRLVLTSNPQVGEANLIGRQITRRGGALPQDDSTIVIHDAIGNIWNWTKVYPDFVAILNDVESGRILLKDVVPRVRTFLQHEIPLFEEHSGQPLIDAMLVKVDPSTNVIKSIV